MPDPHGEHTPQSAQPTRLLAVCTHPVQYLAPLFRVLTERHPEIDLQVLYITQPTPEQQGQGFGLGFEWDLDLMKGYRSSVFRESSAKDDFGRWGGLDAPGIGKAIEEARPDVVLLPGWNCRGLVRALLACNKRGIPVLYRGDTTLWQKPRGLRGLPWSRKNHYLLHRFSGFLAVGKRARIYLRENGIAEERIVDSPHAVDGARFRRDAGDALRPAGKARLRADLGLRPTDFVVLFVGKLEPRKNPEAAVRAVAEMGGDVVLAVCGAGELEASCRKLATEVGARVVWLGFRNQSELPRIYAAADVLVLPSISETWGLAVNEAMAVGTPCVVSDAVGCAPDLIEPGVTGEIFPAGQPSFLVEGLQRLRRLTAGGEAIAPVAQAKAEAYSLERAARGIAVLANRVTRHDWAAPDTRTRCHVLALCDGMVVLGGMERRTLEVLDYVAASGAKVHCMIDREPTMRFRIAHRIERSLHSWSGLPITASAFSGERSIGWAFRLARDIVSSSIKVTAATISRRPSSIFLWSFGSALKSWPALLVLRALGFQIVLRSGTAPALGPRHRWIWKRMVDPVVSVHIGISDFISRELAVTGISKRKARVIRNALPEAPRESRSLSAAIPSVIYVGQVIPEKGILELLDALILLEERKIPFVAILVGRFDGWEHPAHTGHKKAVAAKIAQLPLGRVTVLGEREDVVRLMHSASIHCCPSQESLREGLGQVVLEAKVAGIPSVVTPSGALPEMVRHRVDGWICSGFGAESIAEGLAYFLLDAETRQAAGRHAGTWRDAAFMRNVVAQQWRDVFGCGDRSSA
jgi:glycosyltransferase involved in cell wall biosynthesis